MPALSPILLATDLSPWCDRAKQRALSLARRDRRPLTVLHVVPGDPADPKVRTEMDRAGEAIAKMLAGEAADLEAESDVRAGEPWEEISGAADDMRAELVVLGRHRRQGLRDVFIAPTASRVETGPPVLQATNFGAGEWKSVIVGTDFSPLADQALSVALNLAPGADIHLLHVFEVPFSGFVTGKADQEAVTMRNREALERSAGDALKEVGGEGRRIDLSLARGAVVPTLHGEIRRLDADLLVVGIAGHGGQTFGSTARALTLDPPCDLLVVRRRDAE